MKKFKAVVLMLWTKFKVLSLRAEFVFGFPLVVFISLVFVLKSLLMFGVMLLWFVVMLINDAKTPD